MKAQLDVQLRELDKNLVAKIKRGCSEFPVAFPEYGEVATSEEEMLQYPQAWRALEVEFDIETPTPPKADVSSSLKEFCLSDYLIIQKWIDYAKGIGDPTSELFCDLPVKYDDIMKLGKLEPNNSSKTTLIYCCVIKMFVVTNIQADQRYHLGTARTCAKLVNCQYKPSAELVDWRPSSRIGYYSCGARHVSSQLSPKYSINRRVSGSWSSVSLS